MRFVPSIFNQVKSKFFAGDSSYSGRITVEPNWMLRSTNPIYGNSIRGPFRYFQDVIDDSGTEEFEVPNVKSISWNRSSSQDVASCTITMYNMWHLGNGQEAVFPGQLGKPGYFWPKYGDEDNEWNQQPGRGAFNKAGDWDPNFSWENVLVPHALIRTYEGYGGHHGPENYASINFGLFTEGLRITGVWLVDNITAGTDGMLTISCRDIGRLLLDQLIFPPLVPSALYPLEYYPEGYSNFDSFWGARSQSSLPPGAKGEIRLQYADSSADFGMGSVDASIDGHKPSHAVDGNINTYAWSYGYANPIPTVTEWFEFDFEQPLSSLSLKPWAGGYKCYISIQVNGVWEGSADHLVPNSLGLKFVKEIDIPLAIPDGNENHIEIELDKGFTSDGIPIPYNPNRQDSKIRLSFTNFYYSSYAGAGGRYRCGIRDLIAFQTGERATGFAQVDANTPWTFTMAGHPTNGYWVVDSTGVVHGFGEASNYDTSSGHAPITMGDVPSMPAGYKFWSVGFAPHPNGKGYFVLDQSGTVHARGELPPLSTYNYSGPAVSVGGRPVPTNYESEPGDRWHSRGDLDFKQDPRIPPTGIAVDIAMTHTGNGYWVLYSDGTFIGFGDALPAYGQLPDTSVQKFVGAALNGQPAGLTSSRYRAAYNGTAIAAHPKKMGFWATNSSGEVFAYGEAVHKGQLHNRGYNPGSAASFKLGLRETATSIESTADGEGYWISFGSGKIAAFGSAQGKGPVKIFPDNPMFGVNNDNVVDALRAFNDIHSNDFFKALVWKIARDPDGTGFWVLLADGSVYPYDARFWGMPSYHGKTGVRWHAGNFDGDYTNIVKDLLRWAGFTLYDPSLSSSEEPMVYGNMESTGIKTDTFIQGKWDKQPVIDAIKELAEVVAYDFRILEDGRALFASPNIWSAGNFDDDGIPIYVNAEGVRVSPEVSGAVPFIPTIEETVDLFDYNVTLSGEDMRSELIIGTDAPDPKNPSSTGFVRKRPPSSYKEVKPGVPMLRNIVKPAMWVTQTFKNDEEMQLMAELISIRMWFAERVGSATVVANPCLQVGDQVKLRERTTNETYIHLINGIDSNGDNDSGVWTYNLNTNWLGREDDWVITAAPPTTPLGYIQVSERVDRWQNALGKGLSGGGSGQSANSETVEFTGAFTSSTAQVNWNRVNDPDEVPEAYPEPEPDEEIPEGLSGGFGWEFRGTLTLNAQAGGAYIRTDAFSAPLGTSAYIQIKQGGSLIISKPLAPPGQLVSLGTIGVNNQQVTYTYEIVGAAAAPGNGLLSLSFGGLNVNHASVHDTILVLAEV